MIHTITNTTKFDVLETTKQVEEGMHVINDTVIVTPTYVPQRRKNTWTKEEIQIIKELLAANATVAQMRSFFPYRSEGAIIKYAQRNGYGRRTKPDGSIYFKYGGVSRNRRTSTKNVLAAITEEKCEKDSDVIVAKRSYLSVNTTFDPNDSAIRMLKREGLPFDPDVVCVLTKHILKYKRG